MSNPDIFGYMEIRPVGWLNYLRLYFAYGTAFVAKGLFREKFAAAAVGTFLLGSSNLTVQRDSVLWYLRPGTNDIDLLSPKYEHEVARWLQTKSGELLVDVGAHIGRYTLFAASRSCRVVALEPDPSNFAILQANIQLNGMKNVTALRLAASDHRESKLLYFGDRVNTGTSSLEVQWSAQRGTHESPSTVQVQCETLDALLRQLAIRKIDWLKVDVEGHEIAVLQGASEALSMTKRLILEVSAGNEGPCNTILALHGLSVGAKDNGWPTRNYLYVRE